MLYDPNTTLFIPDAQTLLTVVHVTDVGKPDLIAACLAGAFH